MREGCETGERQTETSEQDLCSVQNTGQHRVVPAGVDVHLHTHDGKVVEPARTREAKAEA